MRNIVRSATTTKIAASVALVAATATVAGLGTFGAFTSTTAATASVGSGVVKIDMTAGKSAFELPVTGLVPGDTVQRAVTLTRTSDSGKFGTVTLTTTGASTPTTILTNAAVGAKGNGLKLTIDQCATAWTPAAAPSTSKALTCAAPGSTVVLAKREILGQNLDLTGVLAALNASPTAPATPNANLRVTLELPAAADNDFQNLSDSVKFSFDATQRTAEIR